MTPVLAQACPTIDVLAFVPLGLSAVVGLASAGILAARRRPLDAAVTAGFLVLAVATPLTVVAQFTAAC